MKKVCKFFWNSLINKVHNSYYQKRLKVWLTIFWIVLIWLRTKYPSIFHHLSRAPMICLYAPLDTKSVCILIKTQQANDASCGEDIVEDFLFSFPTPCTCLLFACLHNCAAWLITQQGYKSQACSNRFGRQH